MLKWIRSFLDPTPAEMLLGLSAWEEVYNRPFFSPEECPFSNYVRQYGVLSRMFRTTRHDN